jgi:hypothetical protein
MLSIGAKMLIPGRGRHPGSRRARRHQGPAVEAVRRSGKFGTRLTRPENAGFTAFIRLRNGNGAIARGGRRTPGESD